MYSYGILVTFHFTFLCFKEPCEEENEAGCKFKFSSVVHITDEPEVKRKLKVYLHVKDEKLEHCSKVCLIYKNILYIGSAEYFTFNVYSTITNLSTYLSTI